MSGSALAVGTIGDKSNPETERAELTQLAFFRTIVVLRSGVFDNSGGL
jgi:hypothetical protein